MIEQEKHMYRPVCDGCGRRLAAEYRKRSAWRAAQRVGWKETPGGLICGVCAELLEETGKLPDRRIWKGDKDK